MNKKKKKGKERHVTFYQRELLRSKKILRLAKSADLILNRVAYWISKVHLQDAENDANILRTKFKRNWEIEAFLKRMKESPKIFIVKDASDKNGKLPAFGVYSERKDEIYIPLKVKNSGIFYPVLFHELIHAVGHRKRLKREWAKYSTKKQKIFEELIAEFGSLLLSQYFGAVTRRSVQSSAFNIYIWLMKMEKDKRFKRDRLYCQPYIKEAVEAAKFLLL